MARLRKNETRNTVNRNERLIIIRHCKIILNICSNSVLHVSKLKLFITFNSQKRESKPAPRLMT